MGNEMKYVALTLRLPSHPSAGIARLPNDLTGEAANLTPAG